MTHSCHHTDASMFPGHSDLLDLTVQLPVVKQTTGLRKRECSSLKASPVWN